MTFVQMQLNVKCGLSKKRMFQSIANIKANALFISCMIISESGSKLIIGLNRYL